MANQNFSDPLVSVSEAAARMGVKERRVRSILAKNLICPVRTAEGIKYRLDDVMDVKRMYS
jgi:hypothetical protein